MFFPVSACITSLYKCRLGLEVVMSLFSLQRDISATSVIPDPEATKEKAFTSLVPKALLEPQLLHSGSQAPQGQHPLPAACPKLTEQNEALTLSLKTMGAFRQAGQISSMNPRSHDPGCLPGVCLFKVKGWPSPLLVVWRVLAPILSSVRTCGPDSH